MFISAGVPDDFLNSLEKVNSIVQFVFYLKSVIMFDNFTDTLKKPGTILIYVWA